MTTETKYLLIGSMEAYSGKSSTILGITHQLTAKGINFGYGKPLNTSIFTDKIDIQDDDVSFMVKALNLSENQLRPTILSLNTDIIEKCLEEKNHHDYSQSLHEYPRLAEEDIVLLEGPSTLEEGQLFNLSVQQIADILDAPILLVARFHSVLLVDALLSAKQRLGDRLLGVVINDISFEHLEIVTTKVRSFLQERGIPVLGLLPKSSLLKSVSVRELVSQLKAEVLCRPDRLDLMVETLKIGAMNVNSALEYFRQGNNMAVVTGGDRTDIQLAALETSTQCLILTGHIAPQSFILSRAEDLEIPILSVDLDTLTTVEIIEKTFAQVRLHEPIKVECIRHLMAQHFDIDQLITKLNLVQH